MPTLETSIWQEYKDQGLVAFAISSSIIGTEDPVALADYVAAMGLTMPVLADYGGSIYDPYRVEVPNSFAPYPREYIVGRDGKLLYVSGSIDVEAIKRVLDAEL